MSALIAPSCTRWNRKSKRSLNRSSHLFENFRTICSSSQRKRLSSRSSSSACRIMTAMLSVIPSLFFSHSQRNRASSSCGEVASHLRFFGALAFAGTDANVSASRRVRLIMDWLGTLCSSSAFFPMPQGNTMSLSYCFVCDGDTPPQYAFSEHSNQLHEGR